MIRGDLTYVISEVGCGVCVSLAVLLCTQYKPTCLHANEQYGQPKNTGDVAHNSRNYEQSYCYYSQILEEQIANGNAWLRKRVAAASLMASDRDTVIKKKFNRESRRTWRYR